MLSFPVTVTILMQTTFRLAKSSLLKEILIDLLFFINTTGLPDVKKVS